MAPKSSNSEKSQSKAQKKKVALALQGGGSHGAFTWGILDRILEDGRIDIEGISGTSAGGLNAVALCQGMIKGGREGARAELKRLWKRVSELAIGSPLKPLPFEGSVGHYNLDHSPGYLSLHMLQSLLSPYEINPLNINPFRGFVEDFFDFEALNAFKGIKLFLCATHVSTGKLRLFNTQDLSVDTVLASACLPNLFQAVRIGDDYYWDGGFVGNPAIYPLIDSCNTSDIMVVQIRVMRRHTLPMTAIQIHDRHAEITYNACLMREMRSIDLITRLIDKGLLDSQKVKRLFMHLIRDEALFGSLEMSSALNGSWDFLNFLFHQGRACATKWLVSHFDDIGVRTSASIHKDFVSDD